MKWICCDINDIDDTEYEKAYREMTAPRRERVEHIRGLDNKKCTLAGEIIAKKLLLFLNILHKTLPFQSF